MTQALKAWGTTLSFDGVTIGEIVSINGTRAREILEVFTCDSADEAVEKLTAGINEGDPSFQCVHQQGAAGSYKELNQKFLAATEGTLLITYTDNAAVPNTSTISCTATMVSLSLPGFGSARDFVMVDVTLTISGKITFTDSAGSSSSSSPSSSASSSPSSSPS